MAMLAEPRQKKRRYNLTPRGKALYEDESRFGTKMLEKMGWSKGKGLGANLHGSKDFVRVRMRNTLEGLGFEDRDDHWTQHEQDFSGLLNSLNGENVDAGKENGSDCDAAPRVGFGFVTAPIVPKVVKLKDKISGVSLEEKSKASKARVHYRKFTKGKDVAQYSEKDLANIFGKKVVESEQANGLYEALTAMTWPQAEEKDDPKPADGEEAEKEVKSNFAGVQTVSAGLSVSDYFKQKMEALKSKRKQLNDENVKEDNVETGKTKKKSKKRKRQEGSEEIEPENTNGDFVDFEQGEDAVERKMKKKKSKKVEEEESCINADITTTPQVLENLEAKEKRKKVKKSKRNKEPLPVDHDSGGPLQDENTKGPKTKPKKEKKSKNPEVVRVEEMFENAPENKEYTEESKEKNNKRKKDGDEENISTTHADQVEEMLVDQLPAKTKKSKRTQEAVLQSEVSAIDKENSIAQAPKTKRKKDKKTSATDEDITLPQTVTDVIYNKAIAKKKKKSKNKENLETTSNAQTEMDVQHKTEEERHTAPDATNSNSKQQKSNKQDVSEEPTAIETLTLDELIAKYNSYNVYTISSFCAEKFRNVDLDRFNGATLSHLPGYGHSENAKNLQLNIEFLPRDEERIIQLWNCTINKYQLSNPKAVFHKYRCNMINAYQAKTKKPLPRLHMKTFKRKSIFQSI